MDTLIKNLPSSHCFTSLNECVAKFQLFADARQLAAMHRDGDGLDFVDARYGARQDSPLGSEKSVP